MNMNMFSVPFLFPNAKERESKDGFLGAKHYQQTGVHYISDDSSSSSSSSDESDSRFMNERETSFVALHHYHRVDMNRVAAGVEVELGAHSGNIFVPSFDHTLPRQLHLYAPSVVDEEVSQLSVDFESITSDTSASVELNPHDGSSSMRLSAASKWRRDMNLAGKKNLVRSRYHKSARATFKDGSWHISKEMIDNDNGGSRTVNPYVKDTIGYPARKAALERVTSVGSMNGDVGSNEEVLFEQTLMSAARNADANPSNEKNHMRSELPPPPPQLMKKKYSGSQFQISPLLSHYKANASSDNTKISDAPKEPERQFQNLSKQQQLPENGISVKVQRHVQPEPKLFFNSEYQMETPGRSSKISTVAEPNIAFTPHSHRIHPPMSKNSSNSAEVTPRGNKKSSPSSITKQNIDSPCASITTSICGTPISLSEGSICHAEKECTPTRPCMSNRFSSTASKLPLHKTSSVSDIGTPESASPSIKKSPFLNRLSEMKNRGKAHPRDPSQSMKDAGASISTEGSGRIGTPESASPSTKKSPCLDRLSEMKYRGKEYPHDMKDAGASMSTEGNARGLYSPPSLRKNSFIEKRKKQWLNQMWSPENGEWDFVDSRINRTTTRVERQGKEHIYHQKRHAVNTTASLTDDDEDSLDLILKEGSRYDSESTLSLPGMDGSSSQPESPLSRVPTSQVLSLSKNNDAQSIVSERSQSQSLSPAYSKPELGVNRDGNNELKEDKAATLIQAAYRGRACRHKILKELGVAKRRKYERKSKTHAVTKIQSNIRRAARQRLRSRHELNNTELYLASMAVSIRHICAMIIQDWWVRCSERLKISRAIGFDPSAFPPSWNELASSKLNEQFQTFTDIRDESPKRSGTRFGQSTLPSLDFSTWDGQFDTEYYRQSHANEDDEDIYANVNVVDEHFVASISLLTKMQNGIAGRFIKIFKKSKTSESNKEKKKRMRLKLFGRGKKRDHDQEENETNLIMIGDPSVNEQLPDPFSLYQPLEDDENNEILNMLESKMETHCSKVAKEKPVGSKDGVQKSEAAILQPGSNRLQSHFHSIKNNRKNSLGNTPELKSHSSTDDRIFDDSNVDPNAVISKMMGGLSCQSKSNGCDANAARSQSYLNDEITFERSRTYESIPFDEV